MVENIINLHGFVFRTTPDQGADILILLMIYHAMEYTASAVGVVFLSHVKSGYISKNTYPVNIKVHGYS